MNGHEATRTLKSRWFVAATLVVVLLAPAFIRLPIAVAQATITANNDHATLEFPERITFSVDLQSDVEINRVMLEYGVDQLTCGAVVAKAFPVITPSKNVTAGWIWEMRQTGSQPPGSKIWWRWRVTDANGNEQVTDQQTIVWLDDQHPWQTVSGGPLNLHWYGGGKSFGPELHASALKSLAALEQSTRLKPDSPIDLYIYADTQDMRDAVLFEPGWTGGLAYPEHNIVIIGISPDQVDWGKRTEAHELTHVLVGHLTFSCLGDVPTWLNEGLAVYGEGGPEPESRPPFDAAVADDTLMSVRVLSGNFSEDPGKADLSYSESYSLVNFLVTEYGQDKMLTLLRALRDGAKLDDAMRTIYGFDPDGFEDAWRAKIGAKPRSTTAAATPTPVPTLVPTIVPISGAPLAPTLSTTAVLASPTPGVVAVAPTNAIAPTSRSTNIPTPTERKPPFQLTTAIVAICAGLACLGGVGLIAIVFILRRRPKS